MSPEISAKSVTRDPDGRLVVKEISIAEIEREFEASYSTANTVSKRTPKFAKIFWFLGWVIFNVLLISLALAFIYYIFGGRGEIFIFPLMLLISAGPIAALLIGISLAFRRNSRNESLLKD